MAGRRGGPDRARSSSPPPRCPGSELPPHAARRVGAPSPAGRPSKAEHGARGGALPQAQDSSCAASRRAATADRSDQPLARRDPVSPLISRAAVWLAIRRARRRAARRLSFPASRHRRRQTSWHRRPPPSPFAAGRPRSRRRAGRRCIRPSVCGRRDNGDSGASPPPPFPSESPSPAPPGARSAALRPLPIHAIDRGHWRTPPLRPGPPPTHATGTHSPPAHPSHLPAPARLPPPNAPPPEASLSPGCALTP